MTPEKIGIKKTHRGDGKYLVDIVGCRCLSRNFLYRRDNLKTMPMAKLQRLSRAKLRGYLGKL